jgi:hypothetical protein
MIKRIAVQDGRRTSRRRNFMIRGTIFTNGVGLTGRVRDLSADGMKIELDAEPEAPLARGTEIIVDMRGIGRVKAEIVWRRKHWYGIRFARPIRPELAMKPVGTGDKTPDYVKPVLVPGRSLKYVEGL